MIDALIEGGMAKGAAPTDFRAKHDDWRASNRSDGDERRCFVTRTILSRDRLIRFSVDPRGQVLPDVDERLPGRGIWLSASRDVVNKAVEKRLFGRVAKQSLVVFEDLADRIEALLTRRFYDGLGLARRAGLFVMGFDQVQACLAGSRAAVLLSASDGAEDGRRKLRRLAPSLPLIMAGPRDQIGSAVGRDQLVHAALLPGKLAVRVLRDAERLSGFRPDIAVLREGEVERGGLAPLHLTELKGTTETS